VISRVNPNAAITIRYSISGSGVNGKYYTLNVPYGQVTIPAGQSSANVVLTALVTSLTSGHEDVNVALNPGIGYTVSGVNTVHLQIMNVP
jgi:hypothetical protein